MRIRKAAGQQLGFELESVEKTCDASDMSKIKNVKLANVLQQMMKQNSTQVVQKML
jgi:hypothetical protein